MVVSKPPHSLSATGLDLPAKNAELERIVSRAALDLHGGENNASSEGRDGGAAFNVKIPTDTTNLPTTSKPAKPTADTKNAKASVLLVEDHLDTIKVMAKILRMLGYEVQTAGTVAEALAASKAAKFDLLISDLGLPDGSGTDVLKQIGPVRAIALSGYGMESDVKHSLAAGFLQHLTKPIKLHDLTAAINEVMG